MAVTAAPVREREHEKPMSWARAILIATGFFFVAAILVGQLPSYVFNVSVLSTLTRWEQGTLDLALVALALGILCFEVAMLYDPRPLIPWPLFALVGAAISVVGAFFMYQVRIGLGATNIMGNPGWGEFLPEQVNQGGNVTYWPSGTAYLFHPAWFQLNSIDIASVGMIALVFGIGMLSFAVLNPFALTGKLAGPLSALLVRFSLGLSIVIVAIYLTVFTFNGKFTSLTNAQPLGDAGNVLLFIALLLAMFALQLWLLPIMIANRQRFMPATYLHGVVGLIGNVAVPLLVIWAVTYPIVNLIHGADPNQIWVQCSRKVAIPESCTFTPFTGYIICTIVFSLTFGLLMAGLYFWSTRRDTIVLGCTIGLIYVGLAVTVIHVDDPVQLPLGLIVATSIAIVAFVFTWSTQREFAPTPPAQLGCTGQWLVLGTLMLIYLFGFAVFSLPNFFEVEALALFYQPGKGGLHDAFWALLLMGGFAIYQFTVLVRRKPFSNLRKFGLWVLAIGILLELIGAIQGFHTDVLTQGIDAMQGSQAFFLVGGIFELVGILACLYGAVRARSIPWMLVIIISTLIGLASAIVLHTLPPYPELVVLAVVLASVGAFAYTAAGPDAAGEVEMLEGVNGNGASSFVVSR
ncbi:MAG TPA: hypothetical protein VKQ30_03575 [Ktedonobacterales bacterium]|nr:hypothetical protein [Ktedonobacterales bacterium]